MAVKKPTLTAKEEKFSQNVAVKQINQSDALRDAYDYKKANNETINKRASEMMKKPHIKGRIEELKEQKKNAVIKEAVYGYKEHMKDLQLIQTLALANSEDNKKELNTALKAMELKGKVSELYNFINKVEQLSVSPEEFYNKVDKESE